MHEAERVAVFLALLEFKICFKALNKSTAKNSLELTTKHLIRKQVKHIAVTDPT